MLTKDERQALEANRTFVRAAELRAQPVKGKFDAAHLKEVNRRLFQDLPGLGFDDVTPGEFRPATPAGFDHIKKRQLETVREPSVVAYSPMDKATLKQLDKLLERADPSALSQLDTDAFTKEIGKLYAELDYVHPFSDGNSRTLREFTRQLAEESGYKLDWDRFNTSPDARDMLYIARDLSVNDIAVKQVRQEGTRRDVYFTLDTYGANNELPELLKGAVTPSPELAKLREQNRQLVPPPPKRERGRSMDV